MINSHFNKKTNILETKIRGEININDLIEYILSLSKNKSLPKVLKIFSDASEGKFSKGVTPEDMLKIVEANKKSLAEREMIYDAFVISSSFESALGHLYMEFSQAKNYHFNIFSTKEAAINWLNNF